MARTGNSASRSHPHLASGLLATAAGIGLAFAVLCIVMYQTKAYEGAPWHTLAIGIGVPSALALAYVCLRRGWEDSRET